MEVDDVAVAEVVDEKGAISRGPSLAGNLEMPHVGVLEIRAEVAHGQPVRSGE